MMILESSRLKANELDVWRYSLKWARATAIRTKKSNADEDLREVLGPALHLIRFPLMHMEEFAAHVASSSVLTAEEQLSVFKWYATPGNQTPLSDRRRRFAESGEYSPLYCTYCGYKSSWPMIGECTSCEVKTDWKCATCDRDRDDYVECSGHSLRFRVSQEPKSLSLCPADSNRYGRSDSYAYRCECGAVNQREDLGNHVCDDCCEDFHICTASDYGLTKDDEPCTESGCEWFS